MMSSTGSGDREILRDLARQYAEVSNLPVQQERRDLWTRNHNLEATRPPILVEYGMWNVWCKELWAAGNLSCQDPLLRSVELSLRLKLFHHDVGDDFILEPWLQIPAVQVQDEEAFWGVKDDRIFAEGDSGGWLMAPVIQEWSDMAKLSRPVHKILEKETAERLAQVQDVIGDILPIYVNRTSSAMGWLGDIAMTAARLRGLEQIMIDMFEYPDELKALMAFLRDGVLESMDAAEKAGDVSLLSHSNQCMCYGGGLEGSNPPAGPRKISQVWGHFSAQELTLVSPQMHEEFMLDFQLPIMERHGATAYGCCEDLTRKIDMLRKVSNLRIISVAPRADLAKCVQQIGTDYVISCRPNPADMVCCGFDENRIRRQLIEGLQTAKGTYTQIHLKDIETLEGDLTRLKRWTKIAREVTEA